VQTFANSQGYILVKKRTYNDQYGNLKNMTLRCDQGRVYSRSETHQRQTKDLLGHLMLYRLTKDQLVRVTDMITSGSCPLEIISTICQNNLSALVIIEALIDELREGDYMYEYKCDDIEKFVKAWTNKFFYLGATVTSQVEGAHATIKTYLRISAGDLHNGKISSFALKKVDEQYQKIKYATTQDPLPICTGSFYSTMGLLSRSQIPPVETNIPEIQPLLQALEEKERPPSASNRRTNNSTRRDPSGFELVERRIRRCIH
ncbi:7693_t:CDS:2, partial [Scutellospora calospora]